MKRFIKIFAVAFVALVTLGSCAQKVDEDWDTIVDYSFDLWMRMNHPDVEQDEYGIYVEKIVSVDSGASPVEDDWVSINYTGTLMSGAVYVTRNEEVARTIGTFEYTTNFCPHFTYMSEYVMTTGQFYALQDMKEGERRILYIPPSLAYGNTDITFVTGYEGTSVIHVDAPIIVDIELVEVIPDPEAYESKILEYYAADYMGVRITDTLMTDMYVSITSSVDGSVSVDSDSLIYIYHRGFFIDGFTFDTNIEDIAEELGIFDYSNDYSALGYTPTSGDLIEGINEVFTSDDVDIKYNDKLTIAFSSEYGYSYYGSTDLPTEIQPYSPLIFEIEILSYMGHESYPYSPYYILNDMSDTDADPKSDVYVRGYVIGCIDGDVISESTAQLTEDEFTVTTNLLITTISEDTDLNNCIVVDISTNPTLQAQYNLVDNPLRYDTRITFYGDMETVKGRIGVTNIEEY